MPTWATPKVDTPLLLGRHRLHAERMRLTNADDTIQTRPDTRVNQWCRTHPHVETQHSKTHGQRDHVSFYSDSSQFFIAFFFSPGSCSILRKWLLHNAIFPSARFYSWKKKPLVSSLSHRFLSFMFPMFVVVNASSQTKFKKIKFHDWKTTGD